MNDYNKNAILIAEDEEINFYYLQTLIEDEFNINCIVYHARNGKEAIGICENNDNIGLILMDMKMPHLNGYEATKIIKERWPHIPVVAQTAYVSNTDLDRAMNSGCNDYLSKPIDEKKLERIIKHYLHLL